MKLVMKDNIWPEMIKNAYLGLKLAVFGPLILIFLGRSKSFGTHKSENHMGTLLFNFLPLSQNFRTIGQLKEVLPEDRCDSKAPKEKGHFFLKDGSISSPFYVQQT